MTLIRVLDTPIEVDLEHDDTVIDVVDEGDWGTVDVFLIEKVYWNEVAGMDWKIYVEHPGSGKFVEQNIGPYESGSKNLPTPARFASYPLLFRCTIVRA